MFPKNAAHWMDVHAARPRSRSGCQIMAQGGALNESAEVSENQSEAKESFCLSDGVASVN